MHHDVVCSAKKRAKDDARHEVTNKAEKKQRYQKQGMREKSNAMAQNRGGGKKKYAD